MPNVTRGARGGRQLTSLLLGQNAAEIEEIGEENEDDLLELFCNSIYRVVDVFENPLTLSSPMTRGVDCAGGAD